MPGFPPASVMAPFAGVAVSLSGVASLLLWPTVSMCFALRLRPGVSPVLLVQLIAQRVVALVAVVMRGREESGRFPKRFAGFQGGDIDTAYVEGVKTMATCMTDKS